MEHYNIYIGSPESRCFWTEIASNHETLLAKTNERIKGLHPLNSSKEGAKAYRERFLGEDLYATKKSEKIPIFIGKLNK